MQPVILLLCVGASAAAGECVKTKRPVSVRPSGGAGVTLLPPVGCLGRGDSHPKLQGTRVVLMSRYHMNLVKRDILKV